MYILYNHFLTDIDWPACSSAMILSHSLQWSTNMHSCSLPSHRTRITAWSGKIGSPNISVVQMLYFPWYFNSISQCMLCTFPNLDGNVFKILFLKGFLSFWRKTEYVTRKLCFSSEAYMSPSVNCVDNENLLAVLENFHTIVFTIIMEVTCKLIIVTISFFHFFSLTNAFLQYSYKHLVILEINMQYFKHCSAWN